jgi:hypothetical protein
LISLSVAIIQVPFSLTALTNASASLTIDAVVLTSVVSSLASSSVAALSSVFSTGSSVSVVSCVASVGSSSIA